MKKLLISFLFILNIAVSFGQTLSVQTIVVTNAGGTTTLNANAIPDVIYLYPSGGSVTLANDYTLTTTGLPPKGKCIKVRIASEFNLNGHTITIFGQDVKQQYVLSNQSAGWYFEFYTVPDGSGGISVPFNSAPYDLGISQSLDGSIIIDGTLPIAALSTDIPQSALDTTGRGRIWYGNATNQTSTFFAGGNGKILIGDGTDVNSVSVSGDIAITSAGVTSIAAGTIVNADVNASAAIALSKLAALTASKPVVTNGSGVLTTANQVAASYGGTGQDFSASTGFQKWSAGTASVSAITDVRDLHASFAANSQGTYYITFPVAATVTNIEVRVETTLSATDSATLELQDNSGTDMTGNNLTAGLLVLAPSATTGTGYTSTLLSNNTFTAGQRMRIISAKTTVGGTVNIQVTYTRNE